MLSKLQILITLFILVAISFLFVQPADMHASSMSEQLESIQKEREQAREQLKEIQESESELINEVNAVEERYLMSLSELDQLKLSYDEVNVEISENQMKLEQKDEQLREIQADLDQKVLLLNKRAASIYKHGNNNLIELLSGAESFIDFFAKIKLMNAIAQEDINIIQEIKEERTKVLNVKKSMMDLNDQQEKNMLEIEKLMAQTENKTEEIESIYNEKKGLLAKTQQDKQALEAMDRQLSAKENEIKATLRSLTHGTSPTGKLLWPTNGRLSSGFGPRRGRFHSGIDIYCPRGTPIIAADAGQVIQTGYHGGYGNFILIYHGGGFATFYAHLDGFAVSGGQHVSRGQTIGYVGTTGWTTGPHLHFEVRINGTARNPMGYF